MSLLSLAVWTILINDISHFLGCFSALPFLIVLWVPLEENILGMLMFSLATTLQEAGSSIYLPAQLPILSRCFATFR